MSKMRSPLIERRYSKRLSPTYDATYKEASPQTDEHVLTAKQWTVSSPASRDADPRKPSRPRRSRPRAGPDNSVTLVNPIGVAIVGRFRCLHSREAGLRLLTVGPCRGPRSPDLFLSVGFVPQGGTTQSAPLTGSETGNGKLGSFAPGLPNQDCFFRDAARKWRQREAPWSAIPPCGTALSRRAGRDRPGGLRSLTATLFCRSECSKGPVA